MMSAPAAPQNKFGFVECCPGPCPPESDVGLAAYYLGFPIFLVVVALSLAAGAKLGNKNWFLPLLGMLGAGAIFTQSARQQIEINIYHAARIVQEYREGPRVSYTRSPEQYAREAQRQTAYFEQEIREIPRRYTGIFMKGWLAYSVGPFVLGLLFAAFRRRKRASANCDRLLEGIAV